MEDEDVLAEKEKVQMNSELMQSGAHQVIISGLTKYFSSHKAVDDIHLAIPKGECFGLLGWYRSIDFLGRKCTICMLCV